MPETIEAYILGTLMIVAIVCSYFHLRNQAKLSAFADSLTKLSDSELHDAYWKNTNELSREVMIRELQRRKDSPC